MSRPKQTGFTLVEILLYIAIASAFLLTLSSFVILSFRSRAEAQVIAEVEQQGEKLMQTITITARSASSITTPIAGTSGSTLILATSSGSTNPTTFSLSGGVISITEGVSTAVALNNSQVTVSSLTFTNLSRTGTPGVVRIQFTLSYNGNTSKREYAYSKVFYGTASLR